MKKKDHIQENMESTNVFIKGMYTDLYNRIKEHEDTDTVVSKMKLSDAAGSIVIVGMIAVLLAFVIIT
jgi:hypothetical protein